MSERDLLKTSDHLGFRKKRKSRHTGFECMKDFVPV